MQCEESGDGVGRFHGPDDLEIKVSHTIGFWFETEYKISLYRSPKFFYCVTFG